MVMEHKERYHKLILEGTHYEIGRKQAEYIKAHNPQVIGWLKFKPEGGRIFTEQEAISRCNEFNQYSAGFGDELKGLADGLGVKLNELTNVLNGYRYAKPCACSVVGVNPSKTKDGHGYIGHSYEFSYEDEYTFAVIRPKGSYAHMGFAFYQLARFDGINEMGLCAAITCLEFIHPSASEKDGLHFSFLVRFILDTCATTREAIEKLHQMPIYTNANIMLGDRSGDIVNVEILTDLDGVHLIERKADPYVYGFNHYLSKENTMKAPQKRYFSYERERFTEKYFHEHNSVTKDDMYQLLSGEIPNGLSCPAYSFYFGTLRSLLYDVTDSSMEVCFGHPTRAPYQKMDLWEEEKVEEIEAVFVETPVSPTLWTMVEE
jgi:predicted choloylglycine hydrolase